MTDAPTSTRARRSEHRRDELLDAAEELFRKKGVAATAVSEITDRAGVAKGTFYLYFESKDHLVAGLKERLLSGMTEIAVGAMEKLQDGDYYTVSDELVAAIRPGLIDTEIHASGGEPDRAHRLAHMVPMKRVGTAEEIANAIVWLISDEASYVTSAILDVSGGR
jgi:AcrR family transcriptional regulator